MRTVQKKEGETKQAVNLRSMLELHEIKEGRLLCTVDLGDSVVNKRNSAFGKYPTAPLQITKDRVIYPTARAFSPGIFPTK